MMFRTQQLLPAFALIASIGLFGCSSKTAASSDDLEGVPEIAAVQMPLTGNAESEGTGTADEAIDVTSLAADELEQTEVPASTDAADLGQVRAAVKRLNDSIRDFLGPIAGMVRNEEPSHVLGATRMWGPVTRGTTEYRFFLRKAAVHRWGWRLDARIAESEETWSSVAAGEITVGRQARRGTGVMGFDLDALASVDPTVVAQGQVLVGFKHGNAGTSVGYALRDFTRDPGVQQPIDALLGAVHLKDGFNRVRLAFRGNVEGTATEAEELVLARVRHRSGVGGRSDLVVLGGDIPAGEARIVSQCWSRELKSAFRVSLTCPLDGLGGEGCTVTETVGDLANCAATLRTAELPPADPTTPMPDEEDPNGGVEAPNDIPNVLADTE